MLTGLRVRDIVLIERLELHLAPGLTVLTGETGAGKSIVLDALGLALGGRADRAMVRAGMAQGSVTATFRPKPDHPVWALLEEQSVPVEEEVVLRRSLGSDGRTKAFVNDEPVGAQLLRRIGQTLVEIHGQHDQRGLLDPAEHRRFVDAFGGLGDLADEVRDAHGRWREAAAALDQIKARLAAAAAEEEYLRHVAVELADLAPAAGEEEALARHRTELQNQDKLLAAMEEALAAVIGPQGARDKLGQAQRRLGRSMGLAEERMRPAVEALERAAIELDEAQIALESGLRDLAAPSSELDRVEGRLFALRDAARKHRVPVDELPRLLDEIQAKLAALDLGEAEQARAKSEVASLDAAFRELVGKLGAGRRVAAAALATAIAVELPPLKLERARVQVLVEPLPEGEWGANGGERVTFEVATNPGQPFGPLAKIASGGELSRFMLALKVVLARVDPTPTMVFDEVDAGIGGATADAVGERLARLATERQVLVVTHAPQIAARAAHHLTVAKHQGEGHTVIEIGELAATGRRREIARMLAGAEVTEAAAAAAQSLLERAGHG